MFSSWENSQRYNRRNQLFRLVKRTYLSFHLNLKGLVMIFRHNNVNDNSLVSFCSIQLRRIRFTCVLIDILVLALSTLRLYWHFLNRYTRQKVIKWKVAIATQATKKNRNKKCYSADVCLCLLGILVKTIAVFLIRLRQQRNLNFHNLSY